MKKVGDEEGEGGEHVESEGGSGGERQLGGGQQVSGCEDKGEGRKEDDVADGDGERKGDDRRAASLVLQPLPEDGQQQHRHPERQQCPQDQVVNSRG